jgi:hypothetical protein
MDPRRRGGGHDLTGSSVATAEEARDRTEILPPPRGPLGKTRQAVLDDLFPAAGPHPVGLRELAAVGAWGLVLIALSVLRQTGFGALDTVWAEDGVVFLSRAMESSLPEALDDPYAGYLHVVPRIAAEVATLVPIARASLALALLGAGLTAGAAVLVYVASAGHVRSAPLRAFLAAMLVLHPIVAVESLNSLALAQWPLTYAAFWVALWRPVRAWATVAAGVFLLLVMLSAPLAVMLLPFLLLRAVVVRRWLDRLPALLFTAGLAVQVLILLTRPNSSPPPGGSLGELLETYRILVTTPAVFGFAFADALRPWAGGGVAVAAVVVWVAVVLAALRPGRRHRLTAVLLAAMSLVAFGVGVYGRNAAPSVLAAFADGVRPASTRFALVPIMLLLSALALALAVDGRAERWQHVQLGACAFLLLVAGMDFFLRNDRTNGPAWSAEIAEAVRECREGAQDVKLQTAPGVPSWQVDVSCEELPP